MNTNTLPFASIAEETLGCSRNEPLEFENNLKLSGAATMPPKISLNIDPFGLKNSLVHRQSSILSFQNLSIGDCTSVTDSQYSHYNPSINEPFVSDDADPDEKEMHAFLDQCGVFQVNIKQQLEDDKKSTYQASPSLQSLGLRMKSSPSFIERRKHLFSNKNSTAGSSCSGAQSQPQLS